MFIFSMSLLSFNLFSNSSRSFLFSKLNLYVNSLFLLSIIELDNLSFLSISSILSLDEISNVFVTLPSLKDIL